MLSGAWTRKEAHLKMGTVSPQSLRAGSIVISSTQVSSGTDLHSSLDGARSPYRLKVVPLEGFPPLKHKDPLDSQESPPEATCFCTLTLSRFFPQPLLLRLHIFLHGFQQAINAPPPIAGHTKLDMVYVGVGEGWGVPWKGQGCGGESLEVRF